MDGSDSSGPPIPEKNLPDLYRREAARLRQQADVAGTVEMRVVLLEGAELFDRMAAECEVWVSS